MNRRIFLKNFLAFNILTVIAKPVIADSDLVVKADPIKAIKPTKLSKHCYYFLAKDGLPTPENRAFFSNPGFIISKKEVVVIDTGSSVQIGEMIIQEIKKITNKPITKVINTHYHGDHWLGNQAFIANNSKVKIYSHTAMIKKAESEGEFWINFMERNSNNSITGTNAIAPTHSLKNNDIIKLHDITLKMHHFQEDKVHTEADLLVEVVEDNVIFVGDIMMRRIANMSEGSYVGSIKFLDKLIKAKYKKYIPGHGKADNASLAKDSYNFFNILYNTTSELYDKGLADFEIRNKLIGHSFFKNTVSRWQGYNDTLGKFIVVAIQEVEERMFE